MLNILVAPESLDNKAVRLAQHIVKRLKAEKKEYSVYFSTELSDITENSKYLINNGEKDFVIIGGDFIIHTFLNSIKELSKIRLGIIPTSKQDDFASSLEISSYVNSALENILRDKTESIDYLICNDKVVLNNILIGATAEIVEAYNNMKLRNPIGDFFVRMKHSSNFEGCDLIIDAQNLKHQNLHIYELSIANAGYSKGKNISPLCNLKDGLFNLNFSVFNDVKEKKKYISLMNNSEHIYEDSTKQYWLNSVKIKSPEHKIKASLDGKIYTLDALDVTIVEKGLKVFKS